MLELPSGFLLTNVESVSNCGLSPDNNLTQVSCHNHPPSPADKIIITCNLYVIYVWNILIWMCPRFKETLNGNILFWQMGCNFHTAVEKNEIVFLENRVIY